jgi:hypothetical protein
MSKANMIETGQWEGLMDEPTEKIDASGTQVLRIAGLRIA